MSQRHELETHLSSLLEISEIMGSMKSLAVMEMHKLSRGLEFVQRLDNSIAEIADDFRNFNPLPKQLELSSTLYLLIGSERGFCGDFNAAVVTRCEEFTADDSLCFVVGQKLLSSLDEDGRVVASTSGASTIDEIAPVMDQLLMQLDKLQNQYGMFSIKVVFHCPEEEQVKVIDVFPPFEEAPRTVSFSNKPVLNLDPKSFYKSLVEQYLYTLLSGLLYRSLLAENQRRVQHLEGALRRIEEQVEELGKKRNAMRQEEITEEIEVILLSSGEFNSELLREKPEQS